jgi:hypothetical protein
MLPNDSDLQYIHQQYTEIGRKMAESRQRRPRKTAKAARQGLGILISAMFARTSQAAPVAARVHAAA